ETLAAWLAARLSVGAAQAAALIARGAVQVDGRRATDGSRALPAGTRVTVFVEPVVDEAALKLAYQDGWFLVVDKPPGVPSQATRTDSASALDAQVQRAVPEARMMHRLDRDASGLVLFAAKAEARAPLQAALEGGRIDRVYLAVVAGRLDGEGRVALRIARDPSDERRRVALPEAAPGGQAAASRWRALAKGATATALELRLETGRTHQLRVHLAAIGHPILGDRLYGGPAAARLCLHATRLALPHPRDGRPVEVRSPPPAELGVDAPP
ncbi:MAG TPA: RluA family pseudouridine synthase, partial [Kofleriaceae bacterium]|nr:RluA family pseudouridine synthase [Kofleriaceae bacterium]